MIPLDTQNTHTIHSLLLETRTGFYGIYEIKAVAHKIEVSFLVELSRQDHLNIHPCQTGSKQDAREIGSLTTSCTILFSLDI